MASIYNIQIKTVMAFARMSEEDVKNLLEDFFKNYETPISRLKFESTQIKVERE